MAIDRDLLLSELTLTGPASDAQLIEAITDPPELKRTIDGATTLTVAVRDTRRQLLRSGLFDTRSWAIVDGLHFELASVSKSSDVITLTFEDAIVAALRRRTDPLSIAAGTATRQQIAAQLAAEAGVAIALDPAVRPVVAAAVDRSKPGEQPSSSWDLLGTLAEGADWRRFSDGGRLLFGSDAWLKALGPPLLLREFEGPVGTIDFDLDVGQPASRATVTVDTTRWAVPPAQQVFLGNLGPASGEWLVESFTRKLTRTAGSVDLVREQASLAEPPPDDTTAADGEAGEEDFLPDAVGDAGGIGDDGSAARAGGLFGNISSLVKPTTGMDKMLAYALAQSGKPYVWGASGPKAFDCSGLVQEATRAGGRVLTKPAMSQWNTCQREGRVTTVATALKTRGALLFRITHQGDHVAISLGDGRTMEARGTAYGVGVFDRASHQGWTGAAVWLTNDPPEHQSASES